MCTVSVIAIPHGFRLVSSRDEQRTRPPAQPPAWRELPAAGGGARSTLRAVFPTDQVEGRAAGTWIAASERGLAITLLNVNLSPAPALPAGLRSRGEIIPALLHLGSAHAVAAAVHAMDLGGFAPFRLIAAELPTAQDPPVIAEIRWDRRGVASAWHRAPVCFASSGLGDELVQCRVPLFREMVATGADGGAAGDPERGVRLQDAFHAHAWPDRAHLSVRMARADARTVSVTAVTVRRDPWTGRAGVSVSYEAIEEAAGPALRA